MAKQQRTMRVEQRSQLAAMQQLEHRSDEELEAETRFKAAAQAILGARAAERYDAKAARAHFQRALAAARPQERLQLRRMADASLALAERRAGDLKQAAERLGVEPPSGRQLLGLKFMGLVEPPASAGILMRVRGFPFCNEVKAFIAAHEQVFVVEQNRDAQMRTLLVNELDIDPAKLVRVLHYDGTPITARLIVDAIADRVSDLKIVPFRKAVP